MFVKGKPDRDGSYEVRYKYFIGDEEITCICRAELVCGKWWSDVSKYEKDLEYNTKSYKKLTF